MTEIQILDAEQAAEALRMTTRRLIKVAKQHSLCLVYGRKLMFTADQLAGIQALPAAVVSDAFVDSERREFETRAIAAGLDVAAFMKRPPPRTYQHDDPCVVYTIACGEYVKIGISRDVAQRVSELQLSNPYPLQVLLTETFRSIQYALLVERTAHHLLADCAIGREWFQTTHERASEVLSVVATATRNLVRKHDRLS